MQFMLDARSDGALGKRGIALSDKSHAARAARPLHRGAMNLMSWCDH
jgi:hypothetical protein